MTVGRSRPAPNSHVRRSWVLQVAGGEEKFPPEANQTVGSAFHVVLWAGQRLSWGPIFYNSHPSTTLHIHKPQVSDGRWSKFQRIRRPALPEGGEVGFTTELSDLQPR